MVKSVSCTLVINALDSRKECCSLRKIIITCRHPGPTWLIAESINTLITKYRIYLLLSRSAINFILERYPELLKSNRVTVYYLNNYSVEKYNVDSFTFTKQMNENSNKNQLLLLQALTAFLKTISFDIVIRTTPSSGIDVDEILPTAVRSLGYTGPILAIQDYYGVGNLLNNGEDTLLKYGVTHLATVDNLAMDLMKTRFTGSIHSVGWIAHDSFLKATPFHLIRQEKRNILGVTNKDLIVFFACSALNNEVDLVVFEHVLKSLQKLNLEFSFLYKVHPRMTNREISKYKDIINKNGKGIRLISEESFSTYLEFLAVPDLIISTASMVNIDALAYATIEKNFENAPVSLYIEDKFIRKAIQQDTGIDVLPTHLSGHGSLCTNLLCLKETIYRGLVDHTLRENTLIEAANYFKPKNASTNRLLNYIENIWE